MTNQAVPDPPTNAPYIPSEVEAKHYLYGFPSKARFIARSSTDVWMKPTGAEAYLEPKELTPLGTHRLNEVWEDTVGPAMDGYLLKKQVQCSILNPLRIGIAGKPSPPAFILVGVNPGTLSAELGIEVAVHCHSILLQNDIDDIHVIICESKFTRSATMYKPAISANPAAIVREPFSTTLGIPICNAKTPNFEGTGGFFFVDTAKPGILYLLTARHVLFHPDKEENALYKFREGSGQASRKVLLMGKATFDARCKAIKSAIDAKEIIIQQLKRRLTVADEMEDEEDANAERKAVKPGMEEAEEAIAAFKKLLADVARDWADEEKRVLGHVTLSPPISLDKGDDGFTDDWAVIQIHPSMITKLNFIGNAIDLGSVDVDKLTTWMYPRNTNPSSFKYPGDRLLRFRGTVSDQEMFSPDQRTKDHDNDPVIMVLKNGNNSNLTVGRLNTIRAFVREYFVGKPGKMSKEVVVLPRNSKSRPFSERGDSGSVVIDGTGRVCGILTGGDGATDVSDCTFVTSINFLIKRLAAFGIHANIFPLPTNL
ncbi:hypothetical protein BJ322DRAFT_1092735 [Thelephora terrestris]|uniref:Peptidase S1 domain-containing protein n=1 Tax=Thelephora terrestris TaxID=56493 RepID=A0A9P6H3D4_9AGAM|nr:hypothetical protein BJ322DRAFT_1092735 [Thelephora terrestris]